MSPSPPPLAVDLAPSGTLFDRPHSWWIAGRRVKRLAALLAEFLPVRNLDDTPDGPGVPLSLLDVGCGDGEVAAQLGRFRPDLIIQGIDVLPRQKTSFPVEVFDGVTIPRADHSVDCVSLIDVLHHAEDAPALLREAARVARRAVVIKDHLLDAPLAGATLRFMDQVGNARYGVPLPYRYLRRSEWETLFQQTGLREERRTEHLRLYPWPASLFFDRSLHFLARLTPLTAAG